MSKYHARKTICNQSHTHDSKLEAQSCDLLHYLQRTGKIKALEVQPRFVLQEGYTRQADGKKIRPITYSADFSFFDNEAKRFRVIDTKGYSTQVYKLKRKLFDRIMNDKHLMVEENI